MSMTDEELVRRLEAVPMVPSPDFHEAVMPRISKRPVRVVPFRRPLALGLAWAAAVAIVVGIAVFRAPEPRPQNAAATMAPAETAISQSGDRYLVKGLIDWDRTKLERVETLPDGTVVLRAKSAASGPAVVTLRGAGGEVLKTSIQLK